ncbi:hypothetical protein HELRODRAFT_192788 [Helobdella robusta]|uniref:Uncharacterized protein n=1 Tax=Helobdella robusta TaxID=6412 RepID=T1FUA6_HELRO|nr:hypothetical protein HELRODRAFT_192788 [Helobdella robusta]ESN99776.1 hypothetical protein HELRODRAFT_192788 [Helobdella robusta]
MAENKYWALYLEPSKDNFLADWRNIIVSPLLLGLKPVAIEKLKLDSMPGRLRQILEEETDIVAVQEILAADRESEEERRKNLSKEEEARRRRRQILTEREQGCCDLSGVFGFCWVCSSRYALSMIIAAGIGAYCIKNREHLKFF